MGDTGTKIYKAINSVMSGVGAIAKDQYNKQQGFKYRGVDDVMNALHPLLSKNGVFIVPEVLEQTREERSTSKGGNLIYSVCRIKYTFYADDGSSVETVVIGEGMDSGDKASNKAMAVAFKYACFQMFCIPTDEMIDPDGDAPPDSVPVKKPKPAEPSGDVISSAQAKRIYAISKGNAELCKQVLDIFGYENSREVLKGDYEAICEEVAKAASEGNVA